MADLIENNNSQSNIKERAKDNLEQCSETKIDTASIPIGSNHDKNFNDMMIRAVSVNISSEFSEETKKKLKSRSDS